MQDPRKVREREPKSRPGLDVDIGADLYADIWSARRYRGLRYL